MQNSVIPSKTQDKTLGKTPSVNLLSQPLVDALIADAQTLNIAVLQHTTGATIIDAGIEAQGSLEAGRRIAEICMGGLGKVMLKQSNAFAKAHTIISAHSANPVLACLGSQYAGWSLAHEKFFSLGSGPARSIAQREELFTELAYKDSGETTVLILETDKIPPAEIIEKVARDTNILPKNLTFILTPTTSQAGAAQVVARCLEVALHKMHTLHFPLNYIVEGLGSAPMPPVSSNFLTAMGRSNDAILFGGFGAAGSLLQRRLGLPDASVLVLQGIAFVLILVSEALRDVDWKLLRPRLVRAAGPKEGNPAMKDKAA